jgi:hypothetical protein
MPKHYNEIRGLLATQKLDGLSGKGASGEEISVAESELGVCFPSSYRMFLKEHGWGYFGSLELIAGLGSDIPQEWRGGANLLQVVADERHGPSRFPKEIIPFCQNGAGDWYAINCSQSVGEEAPIVFVAHEEVATSGFTAEQCADSFADWIFAQLSE